MAASNNNNQYKVMKKSFETRSHHLFDLHGIQKMSIVMLLFCWMGTLAAQSPEGVNYQAVVRDGGSLLANQTIEIRFTFVSGGSQIYQETQSLTTDARGLVNAVIGSGTPITGTMNDVPWKNGDIELSVEMNAGAGYVNLGTTGMESVPYSFYANQVADLAGHTIGELDNVDVASANTGDVLKFDGLNWSPGQISVSQPWTETGNQIHYSGNAVGIRTSSITSTLTVAGNQDMVDFASGLRKMRIYGSTLGAIEFFGASGSKNVAIGYTNGNQDYGFVGIHNSNSEERAYMEIVSNTGRIITNGPNGYRNVAMTWISGCNDCGSVSVYDGNSREAGMYVNSSGQGIVFGDVKNFRMEHPDLPGKEIWYASLEGPEAAAYERGTATLVNGKAQISLSDHFEIVAATEGLTVILTPLSGSSKGLAVINKSGSGFEVVELFDGKGNYEFDWEIKAVRKGYENYRVIRDESESRPGGLEEEEREHEKNPAGIME